MIPLAVILAVQLAQSRAHARVGGQYRGRRLVILHVCGVPAGTHLAAALVAVGFEQVDRFAWLWRPQTN